LQFDFSAGLPINASTNREQWQDGYDRGQMQTARFEREIPDRTQRLPIM